MQLEITSERTEDDKILTVTDSEILITTNQDYDNDSLDNETVDIDIQVQNSEEPQTGVDNIIQENDKKIVPEQDLTGAVEERDFFRLQLGNQIIFALCDQGSQRSYIHSRIAKEFKNKSKHQTSISIGPFDGETEVINDVLPVSFEVNGFPLSFDLRISETLAYDAILGKDFLKGYDIDVRNGRGLWRSREGKWSKFWTGNAQPGTLIYGECAGLAEISPEQWKIIENLVDEELKSQKGKTLGKTNVVTHRATLKPGATPVKHARRRMSPAMKEIAKQEVLRMLAEDIIEPCDGE